MKARKALQPLLDFAREHGFTVRQTSGGHLRLSKRGCPPVFAPSTPSDCRSVKNTLAQLRRVERQAGQSTMRC